MGCDVCWVEERLCEGEVSFGGFVAVGIEALDLRGEHGMTDAVCGGCEDIGDACVCVWVVLGEGWDGVWSEEFGEELVVGDRLDFCGDHCFGVLVDEFAWEDGEFCGDFVCDSVVFADEEGVHSGECGLFVCADITSEEE